MMLSDALDVGIVFIKERFNLRSPGSDVSEENNKTTSGLGGASRRRRGAKNISIKGRNSISKSTKSTYIANIVSPTAFL